MCAHLCRGGVDSVFVHFIPAIRITISKVVVSLLLTPSLPVFTQAVTDEQGQLWELLCTSHNALYSLSRIGELLAICPVEFEDRDLSTFMIDAAGKFCAAHNLHPGDFLIFYQDCRNMLVS